MRHLLFTFITLLSLLTCKLSSQQVYLTGLTIQGNTTRLASLNLSSKASVDLFDFSSEIAFPMTVSPDGSRIYIPGYTFEENPTFTGTTYIFNTQTNRLISSTFTNTTVPGFGSLYPAYNFSQDGKTAYVPGVDFAIERAGLFVYDVVGNTYSNLTLFPTQEFDAFAFNVMSPDKSTIYLGLGLTDPDGGFIYRFNTSSLEFSQTPITVDLSILNGVLSKDGNTLYVLGADNNNPENSVLYVINTQTNAIQEVNVPLTEIEDFLLTFGMALSDDGSRLFILNASDLDQAPSIYVVDTANPTAAPTPKIDTSFFPTDIVVPEGSSVAFLSTTENPQVLGAVRTLNTTTLEISEPIGSLSFVPLRLVVPIASSPIGIFNNAKDYVPLKFLKGLRKIL